jgi:lipoyl(octanoyl) transferase
MVATQNKTLQFQELGLMDYEPAFSYQEKLMKEIIELKLKNRDRIDGDYEETPNYLLFVEHPHVYTLGKSGSR